MPRVLRLAPSSIAGRPSEYQVKQLICVCKVCCEGAANSTRGACAHRNLQPDLLGVLRLNPAAQIIRQRGVHPIAARAQNFDFAARRQRQNTVCCVRCGETRLDIVARHDGEPASFAPIVERVNRPDSQRHTSRHKIDNDISAADRRRAKISATIPKIPSQKATAAAMAY